MMDYAARVTQADTYPKLLRLNAKEHGDVIGIIGDNRPDWIAAEIATHAIGAMSLGLYRDVLDDEAAYLLNYGEARLVFAEDEEQVDKLLNLADRAPHLKHIV